MAKEIVISKIKEQLEAGVSRKEINKKIRT